MGYYEYSNYSEEDYLDEVGHQSNPDSWKEHYPSDQDYAPYVFSLDQGFMVRERLVEILAYVGLSEFERKRTEHLLRAVNRDIRDMKFGSNNEPSRTLYPRR